MEQYAIANRLIEEFSPDDLLRIACLLTEINEKLLDSEIVIMTILTTYENKLIEKN